MQEKVVNNVFSNASTSLEAGVKVTSNGKILSSPIDFPDPTRSVASYAASIGLNSAAAYLAKAAGQSKQNWNPQLEAAAIVSYFTQASPQRLKRRREYANEDGHPGNDTKKGDRGRVRLSKDHPPRNHHFAGLRFAGRRTFFVLK